MVEASKEQTPGEKVESKEEPVEEGKVTLTAEQYNALLDRTAELEAMAAKSRREEETVDLDTLVEEGKRGKGARETETSTTPVNLDEMTNTQLAQHIINIVNEQGGARLLKVETAIETLRVLREIDKGEREHEDFWKYEDKIREVAMANPTLSIEDAYQLAKSKTPAKKEGEEKETTTQTEKLLKLPKRVPSGEKPHVAPGSTKPGEKGKSLRESALQAWDEVVGKGKVQIE